MTHLTNPLLSATFGLAFSIAAACANATQPHPGQTSPYTQPEKTTHQEELLNLAEAKLRSISENSLQLSERLEQLVSELDAAESRQRRLLERHHRLIRSGNFHHADLPRLRAPLLQGQEWVSALRNQTAQARTTLRTLTKLGGTMSIASAAQNTVEGIEFFQLASTLTNITGATREQSSAYQEAVDQVVARNDAYSEQAFMLQLISDCSPGVAAWLSCAGLAFNTFARLAANLDLQEVGVQQMLDSSSEIIASRIQSYAELGAQHAREGRAGGFDSLDRPAILDVEVLARSADTVINLIDDQAYLVRLARRGRYRTLREGAEELKRDLAKGVDSSVMAQFRAAYQDAHESKLIEIEIEQIDLQTGQLLTEIAQATSALDQLAEDLQTLMSMVEAVPEVDPINEAEDDDGIDDYCQDESLLEQTYAPYARPAVECDLPSEETPTPEEATEIAPSEEPDPKAYICRDLDRPLPDGLASTSHCAVLQPQPGAQQFLAACQGRELEPTHTCTVVYCNHVFYRLGVQDIQDCVAKIAAQKAAN